MPASFRPVSISLDEETIERIDAEAGKRKMKRSAYLRAVLWKVFSTGGFSL